MIINKPKLFLLIFLPVFFTGVFFYLALADHPNSDLKLFARIFMTALTLAAWGTFHLICHNLINPAANLLRQLLLIQPGETRPPIDIAEIGSSTLAQTLAIAINELSHATLREFRDELTRLRRLTSHLEGINQDLESNLAHTRSTFDQFQSNSNFYESYIHRVTQICNKPLVEMINLMANVDRGTNTAAESQTFSISKKLNFATTQLSFLIYELQQHTYLIQVDKPFDIHDLTDEVIVLLHPHLERHQNSIWVTYGTECEFEFLGNSEPLKAMLFNFLLTQLLSFDQLRNQTLQLNVFSPAPASLHFKISTPSSAQIPGSLTRLDELILSLNAKVGGTTLITSTRTSRVPVRRVTRQLSAVVLTQDTLKYQSICSRVRNLGLKIISVETLTSKATEQKLKIPKADIYFVESEQLAEIESINTSLPDGAHVFLMSQLQFFDHDRWHKIKLPIEQFQLYQSISMHINPNQTYQILLVDDQQSNLHLLSLLLSDLGHNVETEVSPLKAIQRSKDYQFDLIFMDLHMPQMMGTEASKIIRENGFSGPIIALTAHLSDAEKLNLLEYGMTDALLKPVSKQNLQSIINGQFTHKQAPYPSIRTETIVVFDRALALQRANHKESLAAELLEILMQTINEDRVEFNQHFNTNNLELFLASVHKLHGALRYCGVPQLEKSIDKLEAQTKQDQSLTNPETHAALTRVNSDVTTLIDWYEETERPMAS